MNNACELFQRAKKSREQSLCTVSKSIRISETGLKTDDDKSQSIEMLRNGHQACKVLLFINKRYSIYNDIKRIKKSSNL